MPFKGNDISKPERFSEIPWHLPRSDVPQGTIPFWISEGFIECQLIRKRDEKGIHIGYHIGDYWAEQTPSLLGLQQQKKQSTFNDPLIPPF